MKDRRAGAGLDLAAVVKPPRMVSVLSVPSSAVNGELFYGLATPPS